MIEPHVPDDIQYVPICGKCGEGVTLTEADDGTFEHLKASLNPVTLTLAAEDIVDPSA